MCSTCGCGSGELRIEGDEHHHAHDHEHSHHDHEHHDHHHGHHHHGHGHHEHHDGHHHHHSHDHKKHHHSHGHHHDEDDGLQKTIIIHHHHYYHQGDVNHHYHYEIENEVEMETVVKAEKKKSVAHQAQASEKPVVSEKSDLDYGQGEAGVHAPGITQKRMLQIEMDVLSKNNHIAEHNREHFSEQNILVLNLVSSPGSGKTTLLTETLMKLKERLACAVIEGDQQTTNDAERIRATGVPAIQVNTGKGCHLDAQMVHEAAHRLSLVDDSVLFIENVGNLVCPASFDLGEKYKVALLSVTEGEDKPLKYPNMFAASDVMIINKIDLLPYLSFDVARCIDNARKINPNIKVIQVSATSGEGMEAWLDWLQSEVKN